MHTVLRPPISDSGQSTMYDGWLSFILLYSKVYYAWWRGLEQIARDMHIALMSHQMMDMTVHEQNWLNS